MSSSPRGRSRRFKAEINVVPYIDVMLVLLVIFMVAAPLTNPSVIDLPQAARSSLPPSEYIQVTLKPDAATTISVNRGKGGVAETQTARDRTDLLGKLDSLRAANPKIALMIAADRNMRYEEVIQTISEARKMGFERVGLATR
jgi:biopolymer transport protein TolR